MKHLINIFKRKIKTDNAYNSKIAIYGEYKTGTTACFLTIKNSLHHKPRELFEQPLYIRNPKDNDIPVLAKVIIPPSPHLYILKGPRFEKSENLMQKAESGVESFKSFDKHILLLRDPRDRIVSGTLFLSQERKEIFGSKSAIENVLTIIHQKEREPLSVSMLDIICTILQDTMASTKQRIVNMIKRHHEFIFDFEQSLDNYVKWKYEDMIAGKTKHIEKYLGFKVSSEKPYDKRYEHVVRSKTSGDWQHWFTKVDVDFFSPLFKDYLKAYRYDMSWDLSPHPRINPKHASDYVIRTIKRKQALKNVNIV